eukprot:COSAG02_NODE_69932_length_198_cov_4.474747_1_plen_24_part_01
MQFRIPDSDSEFRVLILNHYEITL